MARAMTAKDYYHQSMRSCENVIVYDRSEDLDEWLEKFPPYKISREDVRGWIMITRNEDSDVDKGHEATGLAEESEDSDANVDNEGIMDCLQKEWKEMLESGQQCSFSEIRQLVLKYRTVSGMWFFFVKTGAEVNMIWRLLATEFVHKGLSRLATMVSVSQITASVFPQRSYMFVVSHRNFTDEDSVLALEKALRRTGIDVLLNYKPDIHAWLKIYRNNTLNIRPSIYSSQLIADTRSYSILRWYGVDVNDNSYCHMVTRTSFWKCYYVKYVAHVDEDCQDREDLNRWLDKYAPSRISQSEFRGWIVLEREDVSDTDQDIHDLRHRWNELRKSGCPIDFLTIKDLAKRTGVVSGGWLFHMPNVHEVDILWRKVAEHFASGPLKDVATRVLVSPPDPKHSDGDHMILAKNKDFMDEDEVQCLHEALRAAGVKGQLSYRPDVFNCLELFEDNPYGIGPFIYTNQ